ncbi:hypothetical protein EDD90_3296 [Streptomyces sp. Ag109_O5-1]|uniref:hypothetical protein n=1 Tax=Streptomyces sp. Ag109_O5-1 TaxID=1938851 RepID=UPI000F51334F|nr:hypothetical protein [Streptomyces sp. Ag109_O5-1]RPE40260.1 hypothetical protein EDD90_3296 [Streptomyces sp. Ag109_O5-1]
MSKHGPCLQCLDPAVAWLHFADGARTVRLCQLDLDAWFDLADDHPEMEPRIWGWFVPPVRVPDEIAAWFRDPRNHTAVSFALRREARADPEWLREFIWRDARIRGGGLVRG